MLTSASICALFWIVFSRADKLRLYCSLEFLLEAEPGGRAGLLAWPLASLTVFILPLSSERASILAAARERVNSGNGAVYLFARVSNLTEFCSWVLTLGAKPQMNVEYVPVTTVLQSFALFVAR